MVYFSARRAVFHVTLLDDVSSLPRLLEPFCVMAYVPHSMAMHRAGDHMQVVLEFDGLPADQAANMLRRMTRNLLVVSARLNVFDANDTVVLQEAA